MSSISSHLKTRQIISGRFSRLLMLQYCSVIVYLGVSVEFEMTEELIFMSSLHETTQLQRKYFQIS